MSDDNKYNGWTNRETWLVNLWLNNDESSYMSLRQCQSPQAIRELVEAWQYEEYDKASLFTDLINTALSAVNWQEIFTNNQEN